MGEVGKFTFNFNPEFKKLFGFDSSKNQPYRITIRKN